MTTHAVVIGGGVIGVTTAAALARRGLKVTLLEQHSIVASGATAGNGAQLSYCYTDALASPALLADLPRLLVGADPCFRLRGSLDPGFVQWLMKFLGNCSQERLTTNTRAVLRLSLHSRAALESIRLHYPTLSFQHTRCGKIHLYRSKRAFAAAQRGMQAKNELGCEQRAISVDELFALEPALAGSNSVVGALYSPIDEAGDSQQFTRSLADRSASQDRLSVLTRTTVDRWIADRSRIRAVGTSRGPIEGDFFVLAASINSRAIGRMLGVDVPIVPMKGYSVTLPAGPRSPLASITDSAAKIVFCRLGDQIRIAGIAELGNSDLTMNPRRVEHLLHVARASLPDAAIWDSDPHPWAGLRPMTPDSRPIISATRFENLFLNCGHGMLGWTLACGSAELLGHMVLEPRLTSELEAMKRDFSLDRFRSDHDLT
jgi:D-amino-acid dehydrogenase